MIAACLVMPASPVLAQQQQSVPASPPPDFLTGNKAGDDTGQDKNETSEKPSRLFGVLPNFSTVEAATVASPITTKQAFTFAAQDSFDKYVIPYIGFVAMLGAGQGSEGYARRYATAVADNSIANFVTTAVLPSLLRQDPRYFQLGKGNPWHRAGYASSRSVVTRARDGRRQLNVSEIGGTAATAILSNAYYPAGDRSATNTLTRVGSQLIWDTTSNLCREFWPDIRARLQDLRRRLHHR